MYYSLEQTANIHQENFAYLLLNEEDHVLTITLNRPKQRNAMNEVVLRELAFAISYAKYHKNIWVVVLEAKGSIFCAGADLKTFMGVKDTESGSTIPEIEAKIVLGDLFDSLHKPCIAKVDAPLFAGGFLLLTSCTHVLATKNAKFGLPEVKRGIWPFQVMAGLLKIIPARKVLDWCMRGTTLSVEEALDLGLVTDLVEDIDAASSDLIQTLKQNSPSAIRLGLAAYQSMQVLAANEQHQFLHKNLMEVIQTQDAQEGIQAFREKRAPNWTGE